MSGKSKWREVELELLRGIEDEVFPCADLSVLTSGRIIYQKAVGTLSKTLKEPLMDGAVFDVASLTKVLCTTSLLMLLVRDSLLALEDNLEKYFKVSELAENLTEASIEDVMSHCAGINPYVPFFKEIFSKGEGFVGTTGARNYVFKKARLESLAYRRGDKSEYSDLGFIILTELIERVTGQNLSDLFEERIAKSFGFKNSSFIPWRNKRAGEIFKNARIVPTEKYEWLSEDAYGGIVHDENSYSMGGISGHAGLFTTSKDIGVFISEIFKGWKGKSKIFPKELCDRFFKRIGAVKNSPWAVGWKTPSKEDRSSGDYFSPHSIGHLGYTGCSIWIDLENQYAVVLLSNRVNLGRDNIKIREFRPKIHNLILNVLKGV